jgi:hypothetical protein
MLLRRVHRPKATMSSVAEHLITKGKANVMVVKN